MYQKNQYIKIWKSMNKILLYFQVYGYSKYPWEKKKIKTP